MLHCVGKEFGVTISSTGDCAIEETASCNASLAVKPVSKTEFLIRDISNIPHSVTIHRQAIAVARVDNLTSIKIGSIEFTLKSLFDKTANTKQVDNQNTGIQSYILETGKIYFIGACPIENGGDIVLASPQVAWYALRVEWKDSQWHISFIKEGKKEILPSNSKIQIGYYQLQFNENAHLSILLINKGYLTMKNLTVKANTKGKKESPILIDNLSLAIKTGEFMGIIGPSGAGKSTLLKALRSIMPIASGEITVLGKNINQDTSLLKEIAFVPQDDVVIDELTVEENLRFAASLRLPSDWSKEACDKTVEELLANTGLQGVRKSRCSIISGGQRKRVNLALELMLGSTFLLADEACSGLSALDTDNVLHLLREIADSGKGVILTIHSPDIEALDLMDTLLVLDKGGIIAYYGPAKEAVKYFDRNAFPHTSPKKIFDVLEKKRSPEEVKKLVKEELKKLDEEGKTLSAEEVKELTEELERKTSPQQWFQHYKSRSYYKYLEKSLDLSDATNREYQ